MSTTQLPTRTLGRTGLQVTQLGYGAMELRGAPRGPVVDDAQAEKVLNAVLDGGINYIDTSIDYGVSEERIGAPFGARRCRVLPRLQVRLPGEPGAGERPDACLHTRERRRRRGAEPAASDAPTISTWSSSTRVRRRDDARGARRARSAGDLQRQGKVRFIGMSGTLPNLPEQIGMGVFDVFQIPYSALQHEHERADLRGRRGWRGHGHPGRRRSRVPLAPDKHGTLHGLTAGRRDAWDRARLDDLLDGAPRTEFILRFTLSHPDMHTTIVGTANPEHLAANLAAAAKALAPRCLRRSAGVSRSTPSVTRSGA